MLGTIKSIIDLTKAISNTEWMIFYNSKVYNLGDDEQYIKGMVDISEMKKALKVGLDKMNFKINIEEFLKFEKEYKKEFTEVIEDDQKYIFKTKIPNKELIVEKIDKQPKLPVLVKDNFIQTFKFSEENILEFSKNTVVRIVFNFDEEMVTFTHPYNFCESYLIVNLMTNKFAKVNKSTDEVIVDVYDYENNNYLLHWKIKNKDTVTHLYFVCTDFCDEGGD